MSLVGPWTIYVCPWKDCGGVSSVEKDCRSALHGIPKPMVAVEVVPSTTHQGAGSRIPRP